MIIILDTNILVSELGLTTQKGAAFKFYLRKNKAKLAIPEVIKLETEENLKDEISNYINLLEKNYRYLLSIFGKLKELVLPTQDEIKNKIAEILTFDSIEVIKLDFTFESAKDAFLRVIKKIPPSNRKQQFKDCIIWNHCNELLESEKVILVTKDQDFYEDGKYSNGLNNLLKNEIDAHKDNFKICSDLKELMTEFDEEIFIDDKIILDIILQNEKTYIDSALLNMELTLSNEYEVNKTLYITEKPNKIFLELIIRIRCESLTEEEIINKFLKIECNCTYDIEEKTLDNIRSEYIGLVEIIDNKEEKIKGSIFLHPGTGVIGHRIMEHKIKLEVK